MEKKITKIIENLKEIHALSQELEDSKYWINLAEKEAGWISEEGDWVSVTVTKFKIEVALYSKNCNKHLYWINGKWYNTSFQENYPSLY